MRLSADDSLGERAGGLVRGSIGMIARSAAAVASIALIAGVTYVGHTGGELVYKYGAASAFTTPSPAPDSPVRDGEVAALRSGADSRTDDKE